MLKLIEYIEQFVNVTFDFIESKWESKKVQSLTGYTLVLAFLGYLFLIEVQRQGFLPNIFSELIPTNHFYAISFAFTILLFFEVISLVFSLVKSVSIAMGKQFEILSLILLRSSFKEFIYFPEPIGWHEISTPLMHIMSDAGGALLIFIILGIYYRIQKHQAITSDELEQKRFISAKKLLSLILIVIFLYLGVVFVLDLLLGYTHNDFFSTFYTVLIFSDILLVLISLKYCQNYFVVFRNSAFALTTVFIRLALIAPPYCNVGMAVFAGLFTLVVTLAYNYFHKGKTYLF